MGTTKTIVIVLLACTVPGIMLAQDRIQSTLRAKTAVLVMKPVAGQAVYEIDGKPVPKGQLLNRLGTAFGKGGDKKLKIFLHQDTNFTDLFGTLATAGKVGFTDIRVYCYDRQLRGMSEITIGQEQPYNAAP